jgi:hypothetical protein
VLLKSYQASRSTSIRVNFSVSVKQRREYGSTLNSLDVNRVPSLLDIWEFQLAPTSLQIKTGGAGGKILEETP